MNKEKIRLGLVGLGCRGAGLNRNVLLPMKDVAVTAVCDVYEDRVRAAADDVEQAGGPRPLMTADYREVADSPEVDVVIVMSAWESHVKVALYAMERGKPVAIEVGGSYTVHQCWQLVDMYEKTETPFMFLENCCFGRRELMVLNMVRQGVLGTVVHAAGCYAHDLREEIANGRENRHYRFDNYLHRNCENYPTHELGPIAKVLGIHHGNRMLSLTSTASKSAGLHAYIREKMPEREDLLRTHFCQGDIITTVIRCAGGETITLTLDTTLPRYYSRGFTIRGTEGLYEEVTDSVLLAHGEDGQWGTQWEKNNADRFAEKYDHPIWKKYLEDGVQGSHDGMDWLEFRAFFKALREGAPMPVDVYDAASYMCITALSEESIATGSAPVAIPDFTCGKWILDTEDAPFMY